MFKRILILLAVVISVSLAQVGAEAQSLKVAVLELNNETEMTNAESLYLTDRVRDAIVQVLISDKFIIMTRENIQELLPPGRNMADCTDAECEVEIGRMIKADYIVTGRILRYSGELRLDLKLHHCESSKFLGGKVAAGKDRLSLEKSVGDPAIILGRIIIDHSGTGSARNELKGRFAEGGGSEAPEGEWTIGAAQKAVVRFESDPPGAVVLVDGRVMCTATPCSKELSEGPARVSMQKERYLAGEKVVDIRKGEGEIKISWILEPDFGWLTVNSTPPGLKVDINDQGYGTTPVKDVELFPSGYRVKVSDPKYYSAWEDVVVERGKRREVSIVLKPRVGGLLVSAADAAGNAVAAEVKVDGERIGITPCSKELIIGRHIVEVESGRGRWEGEADIKERTVDTLRVALLETVDRPEEAPSDFESSLEGQLPEVLAARTAYYLGNAMFKQYELSVASGKPDRDLLSKALSQWLKVARESVLTEWGAKAHINYIENRLDDWSDADKILKIDEFLQYYEKMPEKWRALWLKADCYEKMGQRQQAEDIFRKILEAHGEGSDWGSLAKKALERMNAPMAVGAGRESTGRETDTPKANQTQRGQREDLVIQWVKVDGGTFQMGSTDGDDFEKPVHEVTLSDYWMSATEVTFDQYDTFCKATGRSKPEDNGWGRGNKPVIDVNWDDAVAFCEWVGGRLPTEAEWEYAAKGGNKSRGYEYSGSDNLIDVGWYGNNSEGKTHPVGKKLANELGLYDMSGNVMEWCSDWGVRYDGGAQRNPVGPGSGEYRVLRGGSWYHLVSVLAPQCRSIDRDFLHPSNKSANAGFRVCRDSSTR